MMAARQGHFLPMSGSERSLLGRICHGRGIMDSKDRQIIAALQADGRMTNQELSERVNLSPSPCLRRLRQLEEARVIRGYTALVD